MEVKYLNKSIREIFQSNYVVPLYQRNYAWADDEIHLLLRDIYENYSKNPKGFYFIGTLVVLKRKNGDFEVIDGQQRLTTLSLIAKKLDSSLHTSKLQYDSRPEVESFLSTYYQRGEVATTTTNHLVSHFNEAIEYIETVDLKVKEPNETLRFIDFLKEDGITGFKEYFFNQVQLVKVEIPSDIDVAHYFEVMNNRGEQLEEHEIVKARLLDKIKDNKSGTAQFAKIWDACSQMNKPIQRLFKKDRAHFFGENFNSYHFKADEDINEDDYKDTFLSIHQILSGASILDIEESKDVDKKEDFEAIIDFPNFLMHVLKLYFSEVKDIPLNGDELLKRFEGLEDEIDALKFINKLLFYRVVFDRFIVTVIEDEKSEDNTKWVLQKPKMYYYEKKKTKKLQYENTFKDLQESIIKCLSMLQVTFRTKKYKNYLQEILSWFGDAEDLEIESKEFLKKLNTLVINTFNENRNYDEVVKEPHYNKGTSTPHFLFNFIDYLYWTENQSNYSFEFKYRNSVEHHLPQSYRNESNIDVLDCLGNLCLVSKSGNSKMNDESPKGKADETGKYYKESLPAKQLIMYKETNQKHKWERGEILKHYYDVLELLERRNEILSL
ncbi:protein of unknown function DUF262 [Cellulophaga algicola DSM 14237]|uniref:DUF262 domain-containing protein n=1 Tax=Cellulophaga algicola (strain DSM 14237 / IC166 / ACAM 630) TaxID=688270 RepID=E6X961_CELAD|nr:DUF262 domain-containing protein [Cellulophaga algicola]ADV50871.1 protein of unknown function DUF262 [Cellulophaga algicola DSM 14237]